MKLTKIVLIGASSAPFGLSSLRDAFQTPELRGSTLTLVDIDAETLETMSHLARRIKENFSILLDF